jgi:hypothetical protein
MRFADATAAEDAFNRQVSALIDELGYPCISITEGSADAQDVPGHPGTRRTIVWNIRADYNAIAFFFPPASSQPCRSNFYSIRCPIRGCRRNLRTSGELTDVPCRFQKSAIERKVGSRFSFQVSRDAGRKSRQTGSPPYSIPVGSVYSQHIARDSQNRGAMIQLTAQRQRPQRVDITTALA